MMSEFINGDCMEYLPKYPDNYFDLAIVDPPYGNGGGSGQVKNDSGKGLINTGTMRHHTFGLRKKQGNYESRRKQEKELLKKIIAWDVAPDKAYFEQLFRVSRNQVIWGGNYFELPPTRCFLIWRKLTISEEFSMSMCEYAWTSLNINAKIFEKAPQDPTGTRFHPTQKPVELYEWTLNMFAKSGDRILDTHVGSASSLIACHRLNLEYTGFEIDEEYYRMASERLERETAQMTLFNI